MRTTADLAMKFKVHIVTFDLPSSSSPYEMASDRTPNGAFRAKRVPRKETRLQKSSRNIAAIDFGTKNCSLAYITENDRLELTQGVHVQICPNICIRTRTFLVFIK